MKRSILSLLIATQLTGCFVDDPLPEAEKNPPVEPPVVVPPVEPPLGPPLTDLLPSQPISLSVTVSPDGVDTFDGSVLCNGDPANQLTITAGDNVVCSYDGLTLATFIDVRADVAARSPEPVMVKRLEMKDAEEFAGNSLKLTNAKYLIRNFATDQGSTLSFDLSTTERLKFKNHYGVSLDLPEEEFRALLVEDSTETQTDKLPSSHIPEVEPAVTPGASTDVAAKFVAANAESAYQFTPAELIKTTAVLTDSSDRPVSGVAYFSNTSRGMTNDKGEFQFQWGDTISFGIDTFELGQVRGNQTSFTLSDLGEGNLGSNAEALVRRYGQESAGALVVPDAVSQVFARYPNAINTIISLSLSSTDTELDVGDGLTQVVPAEFTAQFDSGLAKDIDSAICAEISCNTATRQAAVRQAAGDSGQILADVQRLWGSTAAAQAEGYHPVSKFHVFYNSAAVLGSMGKAYGQGTVNISNRAFPVMMARNDNNWWIPFAQPKAWDPRGLAYITEYPSQVVPDTVGDETATFGLPFISIGPIGQGKVMMMGNPYYHSILLCPNGYRHNGGKNGSKCTLSGDPDDMKLFFKNTFRFLTGKESGFTVGTNIPQVYFNWSHRRSGPPYDFVIADEFGLTTEQLTSFAGLDPEQMPLLMINGFEYITSTPPYGPPLMRADTSKPRLTQEQATDLIDYVNRGGNILIMEQLYDDTKASALNRLLDSAGIGTKPGNSVVPSGPTGDKKVARSISEKGFWVIERYPATNGGDGAAITAPYTINADGTVTWKFIEEGKPNDKPKLEVASWVETNEAGQPSTQLAYIADTGQSAEELQAQKDRVLDAFRKEDGSRAYAECTKPDYHYEVNCLEYRPGSGIPIFGDEFKPMFARLNLDDPSARAMIKAANLGTNTEALLQHELYYRSKGNQGKRLSTVDLNRTYQNLSVWLWNDLDYRYESGKPDELGFKRFTEVLNCYANDTAQGTICPAELKKTLVDLGMLYGDDAGVWAGYLNPSYPLNYMEKPLTRLMLGRSYWDYDVKADIRQFPGEPQGSTSNGSQVKLKPFSETTAFYAGNQQPTGQWAVAHQPFTVTASAPVTLTVSMNDDVTGHEQLELGLKRPPRMTKTYPVNGSATITVPYGGLVYARSEHNTAVTLNFSGTVDAPLFAEGRWVNPLTSPAPIGEVVSDSFIFTAPKNNLKATGYRGGIAQFAMDLDAFAEGLNDFYALDATTGSGNRKATDSGRPANRHHFVNDIAIRIGDAHSGYPVMNSNFLADSDKLNITPLNSWLLWHEVGHNAAAAPFRVAGSTEVTNNLLALYMQDRELGKMARVSGTIGMAPALVKEQNGHAWALGGAGERLLMFAQLKEWAENEANFTIRDWYQGDLPAFYREETGMKGWNLFQLMHRLTRNQSDPQITLKGENYCYGQNLSAPDKLMLCASYAAQTDLSGFFQGWNPGEKAVIFPGQSTPSFDGGGVSAAGVSKVKSLGLKAPQQDPLSVNTITTRQ